ncbi:MAG TPA: hypothetical protein VI452_03060 [Marmoricola sp.]
MTEDKTQAVQAVVDRVSSYQDGATEGTVADELRRGLDEAGVELADEQVTRLADAIEDAHGEVFVREVIGEV